jgi:hypothetical protein
MNVACSVARSSPVMPGPGHDGSEADGCEMQKPHDGSVDGYHRTVEEVAP